MSHGESCTGGVVSSGVVVGGHKKMRRKRKELDALVPEDKVRRKSSSASLLRSDSEDPEADYPGVAVLGKRVLLGGGPGGKGGGVWACLPGACTLLLLVTTLVGVAAALRLLMLTRRDLDSLHARISSVEASSSELPAKFHESHVRLQELERNQSALWTQVTQLSLTLTSTSTKMEQLTADVKVLKETLSTSPQLTSLPKEVSEMQSSVVTLGSSLQDVRSALKVVRADHDKLSSTLHDASAAVDGLKEDVTLLQNQTAISGREGSERMIGRTVGGAVVALGSRLDTLTVALDTLNSTLVTHSTQSTANTQKLQSLEQWSALLTNLSSRVSVVEVWQGSHSNSTLLQIANLTSALTSLQESSQHHTHTLINISQSVDVVKGVERKLEGSQVQLANTVTELKQQFQEVEQQVSSMAVVAAAAAASTSPPLPASNETHPRKQRVTQSNPGGGRVSRGP